MRSILRRLARAEAAAQALSPQPASDSRALLLAKLKKIAESYYQTPEHERPELEQMSRAERLALQVYRNK
jgi:hypothetical protein